MSSAAVGRLDPMATVEPQESWAWRLNKQASLDSLPARIQRTRMLSLREKISRSSDFSEQTEDTAPMQSERTPRPVAALLQALDPSVPAVRANSSFRSDVEWRGFVTEVDDEQFHAVARRIGSGFDEPDSVLRVELKLLSKGERPYVATGAEFRLCQGVQTEWPTGLDKRIRKLSKPRLRVYFRRYTSETGREIEEISAGIADLASLPKGSEPVG